jgi:hypothetical protein
MTTIDVEDQAVDELVEALASGCTELVISGSQPYSEPWYSTVAPYCAVLESNVLERLVVDTFFQPLTRQASVFCGDITRVFELCPALQFAYVIGAAEISKLDHAKLQDLTVMADPTSPATITAILCGRVPRLEKLALGFSYEHGTSVEADAAFVAAVAKHGLPALTELHLAYPHDSVAVFEALVKSPVFAQLHVLSIEGDFFDDEDRGLAALRAASLVNLRELYLPVRDVMELTDDDLVREFPAIRSSEELEVFSPRRYRED